MLTGQVPISIFANHDFHKTTTPESGKVFLCRGDCSPIHRRSSVYGVYGTSTDCFWCYTWTVDFPWVCLLLPMTIPDLQMLVLLLMPAMLMSVLILWTFAAGG